MGDSEARLWEKIDERFLIEGDSRRAEFREIVKTMHSMNTLAQRIQNAMQAFIGGYTADLTTDMVAATAPVVLAPVAEPQVLY